MDFTVKDTNEGSEVVITEREYPGHDGVTLVDVNVRFAAPQVPGMITVKWNMKDLGAYSTFSASTTYEKNVCPSWHKRTTESRLASGAPLHQIITADGRNCLTVALSDAETPCQIATGVNERLANMDCEVRFFTSPVNTLEEYHAVIYLDVSDRKYEKCLKDADKFWTEECGYPCAYTPDAARRALYSCWYSFHKDLNVDAVLNQCRLAKAMGMDTVIVDDGWQCDFDEGGYSRCGDWEVHPSKVPDMKDFVDKVHEIGMKFMLWYSVPAAGVYSRAHERFADMLLNPSAKSWASLDPRFPEVRDYLTSVYVNAVKDWGLDGLKLDFIDSFKLFPETPAFDERWDTLSLEDGVDKLLDAVTKALKKINPDILIEFRQSYFGPVIRKYGNMIRVSDCPADSYRNRVGGMTLRYLLGNTAVHSDMLMWHPEDTVESAAYQVISTLFMVPQISVLLDKIPADHVEMLKFYLGFWNAHRETLLDGDISAKNPESMYSLIRSDAEDEIVAVSYADPVLDLGEESRGKSVWHINATDDEYLVIRVSSDLGMKKYRIYDCTGHLEASGRKKLSAGVYQFNVPRCGMIEIK